MKFLNRHLCSGPEGQHAVGVSGLGGPPQGLGGPGPEAVARPASGRWAEKGKAGRKTGRQRRRVVGPAPGPPAFKGDRRGRRAERGLDDHGLQQAEAHHEVQRDGRLQVVPVQPQVAQVWHVLQIREVPEGEQVVRANLGPVDLYGERRGEVSRRGGRPRDEATEMRKGRVDH